MIKHTWWKEAVVYQVYPRSFYDTNADGIGDINGITEKLPYIKKLGADVIWVSPFYKSPNDDNGYDISDYRAIMDEFGTMADCERLLNTAHEMGLKVMLDLVVNHSSDEHAWFASSKSDKAAPTRDYYIWREGKDGKEPNNWFSMFGGRAWEKEESTGEYYLHLFSKKQPDLNWENEALRREVYDIMRFWVDKGADGFRMDVINYISKVQEMPDGPELLAPGYGVTIPYVCNGPRVHEFLQEMNREVLAGRDLITVGETPMVDVENACRYANEDGSELCMVFQFEHVMLNDARSGRSEEKVRLSELKAVLSKWQTALYGKAWNSLYWNNHDQPRVVSRFGNDAPAVREKCAKMLGMCLHMMCGTPYIYQGEELGMTNSAFYSIDEINDIGALNLYRELLAQGTPEPQALKAANARTRDHARTPMQWTNGENAGFTKGKPWLKINNNYRDINAESQVNDPHSVFAFYQTLIALRKANPIIVYGDYTAIAPSDEQVFAYLRTYEGKRLFVACNFTDGDCTVALPDGFADAVLLLGNDEVTVKGDSLTLGAYGCCAYLA